MPSMQADGDSTNVQLDHRPRRHRQAGPVRPRGHGGRERQAHRPVRRNAWLRRCRAIRPARRRTPDRRRRLRRRRRTPPRRPRSPPSAPPPPHPRPRRSRRRVRRSRQHRRRRVRWRPPVPSRPGARQVRANRRTVSRPVRLAPGRSRRRPSIFSARRECRSPNGCCLSQPACSPPCADPARAASLSSSGQDAVSSRSFSTVDQLRAEATPSSLGSTLLIGESKDVVA